MWYLEEKVNDEVYFCHVEKHRNWYDKLILPYWMCVSRHSRNKKFTFLFFVCFFLSGLSFSDTDDSQDSSGRKGTIFYSTLPLTPAHKHWYIYLQLCMWDGYHVFLIATLMFTRLLLNEIYHLIGLPFDWLVDDGMFACLLDKLFLGFLLQRFDMGNRWIWTRIDYHPCIKSEPTNQAC